MYTGIVGMEGYAALELLEGRYKPLLADLWSCGKVLKELGLYCYPLASQKRLLVISSQLMDCDPKAHPMVSTALKWVALTEHEEGNTFPSMALYIEVFSKALHHTYVCFCRTFPTVPMSAHELLPCQPSMQQIPATLL